MVSEAHPRNPWIRNGRVAELYLWSVRRDVGILRRFMELLLGTEIGCDVPEKLFLPHPYGIIVGRYAKLGSNVTLMQQVTLGGKNPWCREEDVRSEFPTLEDGVYVGAGAKVLGGITIGAWAIVGANAVVTKDVPPESTVIGHNQITGTNIPRARDT